MLCATNKNLVSDIQSVSRRYGLGGIVIKDKMADGQVFRFECSSVDAINQYMSSECHDLLNRSEMDLFLEFISYEDGTLVRDDLAALDSLLVQMVLSGESCITLQGANCG